MIIHDDLRASRLARHGSDKKLPFADGAQLPLGCRPTSRDHWL